MMNKMDLDHEIDQLKFLLENTAKQHQYDMKHPKVIVMSQKLDHLILEIMREKREMHS